MEPRGTELKTGETVNDKLRVVLTPLQSVIDQAGIPEHDARLRLDERYHEITSIKPYAFKFTFQASIEASMSHVGLPEGSAAVIKYLTIPKELRKKGVGSQIVRTWEEGLSEQGVRIFAATNIRDKPAFDFWRKLGYQARPNETRNIPYVMYKVLEPPTPSA